MHRAQNIRIVVMTLLTVLVLAYIWGNSLQDSQTSNAQSSQIADRIKPVLDPEDTVAEDTFHVFTRKLAHGVEFCLLGIAACLLADSIAERFGKCSVFMPLFLTLSAAVADEFLQSFTGRTSSVKDIWIDFGGAAAGIVCTAIVLSLIKRKRRNKSC